MAASFAVMFGVWNPYAGFGVFLPILAGEFGWGRGAISLAASLNLFVGGAIAFGVGAASDRYGPRGILALSGLMVGTSYLLASTMSTLWHLYLLLGFLLGVGMSGMYVVPTATVSRWFVTQRGLALGVVLAGLNLAYVTGAPLSAFFISTFGWRAAYLLLGGLVLAVAVPASLLIQAPPSGNHARRPIAEAAGRAVSEATVREAMKDRRLWFLLLTWFLLGFALMIVVVHMVPYLHDRRLSLAIASLVLTIYGVSSIAGRILFGATADRLGTAPTFWFCSILQILSLTSILVGPSPSVLYFLIMWFGLGAAGADTVVVKAAAETFGVRAIGAITGVVGLGWRCGAALGPTVAGVLYDVTGAYTIAFGLASAGLVASLVLFTLGISGRRPALEHQTRGTP
ncbi:MAG: MFS transporter [Candidatus Rokubacteria bacterium]|nr:MFS transporter [Candidatus Rokubacteria bacterium]